MHPLPECVRAVTLDCATKTSQEAVTLWEMADTCSTLPRMEGPGVETVRFGVRLEEIGRLVERNQTLKRGVEPQRMTLKNRSRGNECHELPLEVGHFQTCPSQSDSTIHVPMQASCRVAFS